VFPIGQGNIGADACVFQRFDVLDGAILGITRHVARPQFPTKAGPKDEVAHGLVIHDFRRRHQHLENDARFAAIDDVVHVVAQVRPSILQAHGGGIRIRGADFEVRCPLVETMNLPLLPTFLRNPVVPRGIVLSKFLLLCLREGNWQWGRHSAHHTLYKSAFWRRGNDLCRCFLWLLLARFIRKQGDQMGLDSGSNPSRHSR